ncbi:MAG: VWA domain-containing protein [Pseudomonadota bacterium]
MLSFEWPWMAGALALPLLAHWLLPARGEQSGRALKAPSEAIFTGVLGHEGRAPVSAPLRTLLAALAYLALVAAAMRPAWVEEPIALPREGRALMLAIDISGSMQEQDMELSGERLSRIAATKRVASDFVRAREGDRIGLLLFGTYPYLQTPLTFDRQTVIQHIQEARLTMADDLRSGIHATAIGDAIGLAIKRLRELDDPDKTLILLTDGSDNASRVAPRKAAELAAAAGLKIYTIGIGAEERRASLLGFNFGMGKNREIDEEALTHIAETTGGQYFRARDSEELASIYGHIDELEASEAEAEFFRPEHSLFHYPLAAALGLFALWLLLRERGGET